MKVSVLSLHHREPDGFDRSQVEAFCRDHDILSSQPRFFNSDSGPTLALVLEHRDRLADTDWHRPPPAADSRNDVPPEHRPLFHRPGLVLALARGGPLVVKAADRSLVP